MTPGDEVLGAWLAKGVRPRRLSPQIALPATLVDKAIAGCIGDEVEEIRALGHTHRVVADRNPRRPRYRGLERSH